MKYVIRIGAKSTYGFNWNYYNGNVYYIQDKCYVESLIGINQAKRYSKRKNAEKVADKLRQECVNVDLYLIEEVEDHER